MPTGLYYTPDGDLGVRVVSQNNRFHSIDNSTALELTHRLNIGGSFISSVEDFGMFRRWGEDTNYLLESGVHRMNHQVHRIKYAHMPAFIAPPKLYQTSWKKSGGNVRVNHQMYNFTWKIPIELGFGYLVRLHFCELDDGMTESERREFSVLINDHVAETRADVMGWSSGYGIPVYRDYVVKMKGDKEGSKYDMLIALQTVNELVLGLLSGIEIFRLSNLGNSLATPNPKFPKRVSASWNLRIQKVFLAFGKSNVIVTGITILIVIVNVVVYNLRQTWEEKFRLEKDTQAARIEPSSHQFSLAEIKIATQNFSDAFVIGRGGFGKVYKGFMQSISEDVAIKRLSLYSRQGAREFWTEIETLSKLRHVHLVSLLGYCNEGQEMILVYEYMPCGTLADNLYKMSRKGRDISPLSWEQRLKICIGAARGMEYLHTGTECAVIHRDVKDSNILLDKNFVAKVSDFGLSRLEKITQSKSYVSTKIKGTAGYWDPEYVMTRRLTRKSDVYSFGVVLLVVLSGRPVVDSRNQEEQQSLLSCFRECIAEGDIDRIVDPSVQGKISSRSLREFLKCVENCLHHLPKKRPTMAQVVVNLEQALEQQKSPMISSSRSASAVGHEEVPLLGETVLHSPDKGITSESTQNPYPADEGITILSTQNSNSPPRGNDLHSNKNDSRLPKPSRSWQWKAVWNRGSKFFSWPVVKKDLRLLMVGLANAGKTTILYKLKFGKIVTTIPTIGFNVETVEHKNINFNVWDIWVQDKIRPLWRYYFHDTQGLVFVVDSNDRDRVFEARNELHMMLNEDELRDAVLLVFANKQDLPNAMNAAEVAEKLGLHFLRQRHWYIQSTCAISGEGLYEGLDWLSSNIANKA
ncbi:hypothetical protein ACH5RR_016400 [Cinchona calisaya]|uniref:ADP-ribosylation factor 1 n=1 Tax=Cinchona calisaya TaxID=153742 RepID=A0ABD2ZVV1_9GENT